MRLLHARTNTLHNFAPGRIPQYTILSHTWSDSEVSLQDLRDDPSVDTKPGYAKIDTCCEKTLETGLEYTWIDTCCIDKTSSAELSEAINSMYDWYRASKVCFAYLADVPESDDPEAPHSAFRRSRWFTRGWTLQEMLAPRDVIFFSREWTPLGTKSSMLELLSSITKIQMPALDGSGPLSHFSIAQRMSWAASRVTTRPEDVAYCLVGLFDVNMPLLYGEGGSKAFKRLCEEIMKDSDDHSIFAWEALRDTTRLQGLLASSPAQYLAAGSIVPHRDWKQSVPYSITNKGLRIELFLLRRNDKRGGYYWAILDCHLIGLGYPLAVELKALTEDGDQFARVAHEGPFAFKNKQRGEKRMIFIRNVPIEPEQEVYYQAEVSRFPFEVASTAASFPSPEIDALPYFR
jgi:Heterokaryon incompatibility protein (HET)